MQMPKQAKAIGRDKTPEARAPRAMAAASYQTCVQSCNNGPVESRQLCLATCR